MHEYSITSSIVEIIEKVIKEKKLTKVEEIKLELSPIASIEPESVMFYFDFLTKGNVILKDAKLKFKTVRIEVRCENCGFNFRADNLTPNCPRCSNIHVSILDKNINDIKIISISAEQ